MKDKIRKSEDKVTKAGAIDLTENELDDAAGGALVNESISLNFSKIRLEYNKIESEIVDTTLDTPTLKS